MRFNGFSVSSVSLSGENPWSAISQFIVTGNTAIAVTASIG